MPISFTLSSPYIVPLLVSALIALTVTAYIWTRRSAPSAVALIMLSLVIAEWALGYALEIAGTDFATKFFWGKLQYIGIATVPFFWVIFAFNHANQANRLTHVRMFLLAAVPVVTIALALTTEQHGLLWRDFSVVQNPNFSALKVSYGYWFWIHFAYSYIMLAAGTFIVLRSIGRMKGLYRGQTLSIMVSALVPWMANILYFSGLNPIPNLDLTPFAFTITVAGLAWGIFGFQLVDITPVARDMVVENMREGMLVIDMRGRILDINQAAGRMIGLPATQAIGKEIREVLAPWPHLLERFRDVLDGREIITVGQGQAERRYAVQISPLQDRRERIMGRLITIRDLEIGIPEPRLAIREPITRPVSQTVLPAQDESAQRPAIPLMGWLWQYFFPPVLADLPARAGMSPAWGRTIERTLTTMLRVSAALGTIALAIFVSPAPQAPSGFAITLAALLAVIWLLGLARAFPYFLRVSAFLVLVYVLSFYEMYNFGFSAESFAYFLGFISLTALFSGLRGSLWGLLFTSLTMSVFGWLIGSGLFRPVMLSAQDAIYPPSVTQAFTSLSTFVASGVGLVAAINVLLSSLNQAWQKETQALNLLQQERDLLEQRVVERTSALAQARDQAVQSSNELRKYFQAMEQSGNSIVITNIQGDIEYVNPYFEKRTGYSFAEVRGKNPRILKSDEQSRELYQGLWNTISKGKVWSGELHNRRKDGTLFWELATIAPVMDANGTITHYVAVKEDISTLKQAQEALAISRDQALEASRLKSQLLSRVSHELRTPLGAVLGYAELLSTETFGPLNDEQKDAAVQIVESADYLNQMVNDLLDEAQIESKSLALKIAFFHLEELIQKARAPIEVLARAKGLDFTLQVAPDLPLRLYGDERRIQQIIMNLAGNAIKFTEQGRVSVCFYQASTNQWAIQVSDTGSGIPKEAHEFIFEPFRQVNNAITRENRGTGLGLSITRQLVELMDGEISLESELGKGSTFIVTLPIIRKEEQTQP